MGPKVELAAQIILCLPCTSRHTRTPPSVPGLKLLITTSAERTICLKILPLSGSQIKGHTAFTRLEA